MVALTARVFAYKDAARRVLGEQQTAFWGAIANAILLALHM